MKMYEIVEMSDEEKQVLVERMKLAREKRNEQQGMLVLKH